MLPRRVVVGMENKQMPRITSIDANTGDVTVRYHDTEREQMDRLHTGAAEIVQGATAATLGGILSRLGCLLDGAGIAKIESINIGWDGTVVVRLPAESVRTLGNPATEDHPKYGYRDVRVTYSGYTFEGVEALASVPPEGGGEMPLPAAGFDGMPF